MAKPWLSASCQTVSGISLQPADKRLQKVKDIHKNDSLTNCYGLSEIVINLFDQNMKHIRLLTS